MLPSRRLTIDIGQRIERTHFDLEITGTLSGIDINEVHLTRGEVHETIRTAINQAIESLK